jgi:processive 1,2-diacylglycerol beta-glucosyltransferase
VDFRLSDLVGVSWHAGGWDVMQEAVLLAGSIGLGHEMMARSCTGVLERSGWHTRSLDSMAMLGPLSRGTGDRVFNGLVARAPALYDGLHFAHLRTGSRLAKLMDRAAVARLIPALRAELQRNPADLVLSVFATGASAAAKLKAEEPGRRTVVLCTDVAVHRMWVWEGTDLFLVTSTAAEASVRRYLPRATVAVMPPPVRAEFYTPPSRELARNELGVAAEDFCVLVIDSGWGLGPVADSVAAMARAGIHVLAVAGRCKELERRFRELSLASPRITAFGFTDRVPELMAAADVVVALPGATTCSEARVVGRQLLLLDLMPGHGRDNLQHELELGAASVCTPTADGIAVSALSLRDQAPLASVRTARAERWEPAFTAALERIGITLRDVVPAPRAPEVSGAPEPTVSRAPATAAAGGTSTAGSRSARDNGGPPAHTTRAAKGVDDA